MLVNLFELQLQLALPIVKVVQPLLVDHPSVHKVLLQLLDLRLYLKLLLRHQLLHHGRRVVLLRHVKLLLLLKLLLVMLLLLLVSLFQLLLLLLVRRHLVSV